MKSIFLDIKTHLKEDFKWSTYSYFALFLTVSIYFNYKYDIEDSIIDPHLRSIQGFLYYLFLYLFGYYGMAVPQLILSKKTHVLKQPRYWIRSGFFILVCSFAASFYLSWFVERNHFNHFDFIFTYNLFVQGSCFITTFTPLLIFWLITKKGNESFYGFRFRNTNLKPYFIMLGCMMPLLIWASFQSDFQETYPALKSWKLYKPFGLSEFKTTAIFESFYGFSFICVELLFRGALIIGLSKILGKEVILPMVTMYAFLHFGKPMAETIGSIFGSYILGVVALKKEHLFGGIIIHMGVALSMDLLAMLQHYVIQHPSF